VAVVVQRAQAVEQHHEAEHQRDHAADRNHADVEHRAHLVEVAGVHGRDQPLQAVAAADLHAVARAEHLGGDHAHQVEQQEHAAGDDRRPQERAAVFPELALEQPVERLHA
jgi:hypothetical protein